MDCKQLRLDELYNLLKQDLNATSFSTFIPSKKHLTAANIISVLFELNPHLKMYSFQKWHEWEIGSVNISPEMFINEALQYSTDYNQELYILFDDCFKNDAVYLTSLKSLIRFDECLNLKQQYSTLFEPFDHIFYFHEAKRLVVVYHEGKCVDECLIS
jgi:lipopolysaccharide assembly outer membrane protein LptD (OstA)